MQDFASQLFKGLQNQKDTEKLTFVKIGFAQEALPSMIVSDNSLCAVDPKVAESGMCNDTSFELVRTGVITRVPRAANIWTSCQYIRLEGKDSRAAASPAPRMVRDQVGFFEQNVAV